MKVEIVDLNRSNILLLNDFLNNIKESSKTFRYFKKRDISVIHGHLVTLMLVDHGHPIAYGHLENEGNEVWLGICVRPQFINKGHGKEMMHVLFERAKLLQIEKISLTVDKTNLSAINLYTNLGFVRIFEGDTVYKYQLVIT